MKNVDKLVKENLTIEFNYIDLFYAYCGAKGFEDPEDNENMTDEQYDALQQEFEAKIKPSIVYKLREAIMADGMERIDNAMYELAKGN